VVCRQAIDSADGSAMAVAKIATLGYHGFRAYLEKRVWHNDKRQRQHLHGQQAD